MPGVASYTRTTGAVGLSGYTRRKTCSALGGPAGGDGGGGGERRREHAEPEHHAPKTPDEDPIVKFARSRAA